MIQKKIAVIGAGLSGLVAIKELLAEGHDVTAYEQSNEVGGVFSSCYDSVLLTVSNYSMAYSDFFPYNERLRFWTANDYKKYLNEYADHFKLRKHIRFNTKVSQLKKENNKWQVDTADNSSLYDNVVIASGLFQKPYIPTLNGLDTFTGKIVHSSEFKNVRENDEFKDKRVLCVGLGESSSDITSEIASVAKETTLSIRRYHVFATRKIPTFSKRDANLYSTIDAAQSRGWHNFPSFLKSAIIRKMGKKMMKSKSKPIRLLGEHVSLAGDEAGSVVTKTERIFEAMSDYNLKLNVGGIQEIKNDTVIFNSGEKKTFDVIVFCTGFEFSTSFLDFKFKDIKDCYKNMIHPELGDSLAFIGFARPQQGGIPLMAELQSRYYALLCSNRKNFPSNAKEIAQKDKQKWATEFYETPGVFGLVNGLRFNENLAQLIGCQPPKPSLFLSPKKWYKYWFGHIWSCQYRLKGPGANIHAKRWIETDVHGLGTLQMVGVIIITNMMKFIYQFIKIPAFKFRPIVYQDKIVAKAS